MELQRSLGPDRQRPQDVGLGAGRIWMSGDRAQGGQDTGRIRDAGGCGPPGVTRERRRQEGVTGGWGVREDVGPTQDMGH